MRHEYILKDGELQTVEAGKGNVVLYADPTPQEREHILATLPIEWHTLESMLDPFEISRAEFEPDSNIIIWKRVGVETADEVDPVGSVGLVMERDKLTVVGPDAAFLSLDSEHSSPKTLNELVLRAMQDSVSQCIIRLRTIRQTSKEMRGKINQTLDNLILLRMFDLSESLVYVVDAIDSNAAVLKRLAEAAESLGCTAGELDLLDEIRVDNEQCSRQGHIYLEVFPNLIEARNAIVNNNLSVFLKNLTIASVVFLPLTVIASIGGMSEFSRFLDSNGYGFLAGFTWFTGVLVVLGLAMWIIIGYWAKGGERQARADVERQEAIHDERPSG